MPAITQKIIGHIQSHFPNLRTEIDVSWPQLTTLGVGTGTIPLVVEPTDNATLSSFLKYCYTEGIEVFLIGGGSNLVGMDKTFPGIVLKLKHANFTRATFDDTLVTVGAGMKLYDFITACAHKSLGGIEQLAGIPGTVGGSLQTNAGRLGVTISEFIEEIHGFDLQGNPWKAASKEIKWGYRCSSIPEDIIVTSVIFRLNRVEKSAAIASIQEALSSRSNIYPTHRNAGCIFRNPPSGHGAGKLIELAGCKSLSANNIEVSSKHANFIVNKNNGSEKDFLKLATKVKERVLKETGIHLDPEVRFVDKNSFSILNSSPKRLKVAVIKGGNSHERTVSLVSAKAVSKALKEAGYHVTDVDIQEAVVTEEMKEADITFPVLHGGFGENGQIQKELEKFKLPYVGSDSSVSQIVIDKIKTKDFFRKNNILTPEFAALKHGNTTFPENLSLPVVVKPPTEGSSFGVSIVRNMSEWKPALKKASIDSTGLVLVEEYIDGPELTIGILNGKALPIVHICYPGEMYDYDAKYTHECGKTEYISPPNTSVFPVKFQEELKQTAIMAYNQVAAKDFLRVDVIVSKKNNTAYFIEMNSIPGVTPGSLLPKAAATADIPYIQMCGILIQLAATRRKRT